MSEGRLRRCSSAGDDHYAGRPAAVAQAPQSGFQTLSAPARMVLLNEQTRDWNGAINRQCCAACRYSSGALLIRCARTAALIFLPTLIRWIYTSAYVDATLRVCHDCGRRAVRRRLDEVLPVTIGRPGLRSSHGIETIVVLPLVVVLGAEWAPPAPPAMLVGMVVFAVIWVFIFLRIEPSDVQQPRGRRDRSRDESEVGALTR
jgi:hypothetical protein